MDEGHELCVGKKKGESACCRRVSSEMKSGHKMQMILVCGLQAWQHKGSQHKTGNLKAMIPPSSQLYTLYCFALSIALAFEA